MSTSIPWLNAGDPFPLASQAWGDGDPMPGLLAAGGQLDVPTLVRAYSAGIFPWFSDGQPILWWSPNPRMVMVPGSFRLHRSMRQTLRRHIGTSDRRTTIDQDFQAVITACATSDRAGQDGTWIVPKMVEAYCALHAAGFAHSIETWNGEELVGGLYCVAIGGAVFGESMFARETDASKIAMAALMALCRHHRVPQVDCQQNTRHLASLGACEIPRSIFLANLEHEAGQPAIQWRFDSLFWDEILA